MTSKPAIVEKHANPKRIGWPQHVAKRYRSVKKQEDGRAMLNIGCGRRTNWEWNNLDFSPYARLVHRKGLVRVLHALHVLSDLRYESILTIAPDIICWDVRKGLPFSNNVFDVVYNSHFIPHLDHDNAVYVMRESLRVLKCGGTLRVVVPDLALIAQSYVEALAALVAGKAGAGQRHQSAVDELFELMVRHDPVGTSRQNPLVRRLERIVRGDILARGELRRWHYDRYSMGAMMRDAGFGDIQVTGAAESRIQGWTKFHLDTDANGCIYKPGSLYMEGVKPHGFGVDTC